MVFADADDGIDLDTYEILINALESTQSDISACNLRSEYRQFEVREKNQETDILTYQGTKELVEAFFFKIGGWAWNKLYRREVISDVRFREDISQAEDALFSWQVIKKAKKICYTDLPLYHYRFALTSSSRMANTEKLKTAIIAWDIVKKDLDSLNIDEPIVQKWANNYIVWNLKICESMISLKHPEQQKSYMYARKNIAKYKKYIPAMSRRYQILARSVLTSWGTYKFLGMLSYGMKKAYVNIRNR